jgi:hypothetical protein
MATEQYDAPQGADKTKVVLSVGGGISGLVRITVDTSKSKFDVLRAIEAIEQKIVEGKWPPV